MRRQSEQKHDEIILGIPRKRMVVWLTIAPMILLLSYVSWSVSKDRYVITARVVEVDAPRECWEEGDGGLLGKQREAYRSRRPRRSYLGYCGVVRTTLGNFALPHTYPRPLLGQKRDDLYDRLNRGCQYDLVVVSPRGRPTARDQGIGRANPPYIRRIMFAYSC
ncbi:MAG: hypothetical protein R3256_04935 [Thalassovita sp.]|nr:hypothetical protein [Thalassovita sp.]